MGSAGLAGGDAGGVRSRGSRLDLVGGGVLAVLIDEGGALGDGVCLGAVGKSGSLRADSGQSSNDAGGGVLGVGRGSRAGRVRWVLRSLRGLGGVCRVGGGGRLSWVSWVLRSLGGLVGRGSHGSGVVCLRVAVSVGVGGGGEASNDSEGAHLDFGLVGGIKYVGIRYWR